MCVEREKEIESVCRDREEGVCRERERERYSERVCREIGKECVFVFVCREKEREFVQRDRKRNFVCIQKER